MDKPPFGYYLRKRFYSKERWDRYIASLDWGDPKPLTPPAPLAVIRPMTDEERMQRAYERAKEQWLDSQVSDYALATWKKVEQECRECEHMDAVSLSQMDMETYRHHRQRLLAAQPFRDP